MYHQHAFPQDFRSGPSILDWDPSKWVILILHKLGLAKGLRRAREEDVSSALTWMHQKLHIHHQESDYSSSSEDDEREDWTGPTWGEDELEIFVKAKPGRCVVIIDGFAIDVTGYLGEHVRIYPIRAPCRTFVDAHYNH